MKRIITLLLIVIGFQAQAQYTSTLPAGYTPFATQMYYKIVSGDTTFVEGASGKGFHVLVANQALKDSLANYVLKVAGKSLLSDTEITRLTGIATGATANSTDAFLLARANHTGVQEISTVTGLQAGLDAKQALLSGTGLVKSTAGTISYLTESTAAVANTIVQRDLNGYIFGAYGNFTSGLGGATPDFITGKLGDNYYRDFTAANIAAFISGQTFNTLGNAATATTATSATTAATLNTTRTIFGQNFNGSANVTGALSATTGSFTGTLNTNADLTLGGYNTVGFSGNEARYGGYTAAQWTSAGIYSSGTLRATFDASGLTMPLYGGSGDVIIGANNSGVTGKYTIGSGLALTAGVLSATGGSAGTVTGSGTAGKIAKWTSASNVGDASNLTISGSDLQVTGAVSANTNIQVAAWDALGYSGNTLKIGGMTASQWTDAEIYTGGTLRGTWNSSGLTLSGGAFVGALTGNASTSTALATARTISGTSFDGTANITLNNTGITNGAGYITAASPALTGAPTAPTQTAGDNSTKIATTAYVQSAITGGTILTGVSTLDFTNATCSACSQEYSFTVTGAALGDVVALGIPAGSMTTSSVFTAYVSATNTVKVRFTSNASVSFPEDPASGTFTVKIFK